MKTTAMKMERTFRRLCCVAVMAVLAACDADPLVSDGGKLPDPGPLENTAAILRSARSPLRTPTVPLTEGSSRTSDMIYCQLTRSAEAATAFTAAADPALVGAYNAKHGTEFEPLPAANVAIADGGALTVATGERSSQRLSVTFSADGLAPGTYLLPVAIASDTAAGTDEGHVIWYSVVVRDREDLLYFKDYSMYEGVYLPLDTDYTTVLYLNTTVYQPLLADNLVFEMYDSNFESVWRRTFGNIVNLRVTMLDYDEPTGRAVFTLTSDMRYVLEHADKYIRPLQDKGRKVCLSIEGAGTGLGFCNLTDAQIADFTAQVKSVVELYGLDGVNLFDRNAGYGAQGMPAVNTTSYPKLVVALREAMPAGMLTLADYGQPTEYFHDTALTGGIAVGDYIDYAWSGYMSEDEELQLLDPWHTMTDPAPFEAWGTTLPTSRYDREPIAGLTPERFGHFAVPYWSHARPYWNEPDIQKLGVWVSEGLNPNKIMVFADMISNIQNEYESVWMTPMNTMYMFGDGAFNWINSYYQLLNEEASNGYTYMLKDW